MRARTQHNLAASALVLGMVLFLAVCCPPPAEQPASPGFVTVHINMISTAPNPVNPNPAAPADVDFSGSWQNPPQGIDASEVTGLKTFDHSLAGGLSQFPLNGFGPFENVLNFHDQLAAGSWVFTTTVTQGSGGGSFSFTATCTFDVRSNQTTKLLIQNPNHACVLDTQ